MYSTETHGKRSNLPALLAVFNARKFEAPSLAESLTCRRSHVVLISVVSRIESTVVVCGLAVAAHISPVGIGDRLDSGGAVGLGWQRLADNSTELSGELLGEEQILRRARGSDAAGNIVHELRVAADTLRVTIAFGRKALSTFLLHTCQITRASSWMKRWSPLTAQAGT
jgi:hypothetical protein